MDVPSGPARPTLSLPAQRTRLPGPPPRPPRPVGTATLPDRLPGPPPRPPPRPPATPAPPTPPAPPMHVVI
jgi:hypothetical protein